MKTLLRKMVKYAPSICMLGILLVADSAWAQDFGVAKLDRLQSVIRTAAGSLAVVGMMIAGAYYALGRPEGKGMALSAALGMLLIAAATGIGSFFLG